MKKQHNSQILRFAASFASRDAAFIMALLGVLCQAAHTWYIAYNLSSLDGITKFLQAGLMALFFNGALLYFVLKGKSGDEVQQKRYKNLVIAFAALEVFMNLYYWSQHFIIEPWPEADWAKLIIALPMSIILPITLAMYSYEVRVDDFDDEVENSLSETDKNEYEKTITALKNEIESLTSSIATSVDSSNVVDGEQEKMKIEIDQLKYEIDQRNSLIDGLNQEIEDLTNKLNSSEPIIKEVVKEVEKIVEVPKEIIKEVVKEVEVEPIFIPKTEQQLSNPKMDEWAIISNQKKEEPISKTAFKDGMNDVLFDYQNS